MINQKRKIQLYNSLKKLENDSFDENDIRLLLIEIRDLLAAESFLREVCNFVAHPERNMGICHTRINSRHAKMKLSKEGFQKIKDEGIMKKNLDKPWEFFSEIALGYMQTPKIEKKLFDIVIRHGIDEIPDEIFVQGYNLSKEKTWEFINGKYTLQEGHYNLSKNITPGDFVILHDMLKFIRGFISGSAVFEQVDLEKDLRQGIERIVMAEKMDVDLGQIYNSIEGVVVCIISILHDANFILFDKSSALSYITVNRYDRNDDTDILHFSLYAEADNFSFPVITTKILGNNYIDATYEEMKSFEGVKMPWVIAKRKDGKLKLTIN